MQDTRRRVHEQEMTRRPDERSGGRKNALGKRQRWPPIPVVGVSQVIGFESNSLGPLNTEASQIDWR